MAVDYKKLKAGDKVRYLGGDRAKLDHTLTIGNDYVIKGMNKFGMPYFPNDSGMGWSVTHYNAHCFELVDDDKSESTCKCDCKHDSHIVSLATKVAELTAEVAQLKEELYEFRSDMWESEVELSDRIETNESDIALLDERLIEVEERRMGGSGNVFIEHYYGGGSNE